METSRDLASLVVPLAGELVATDDPWEPYRLLDPSGASVAGVADYLRDLQGVGRPSVTARSYGMDLLRWFRFLWAVEVPWERATRLEARDFSRWLLVAGQPARPHWRSSSAGVWTTGGKPYAASVRAHSETVLRAFYDFHLEAGTGPILNPFPLHRSRRGGRAHAHHNPMEPHAKERAGLYRPTVPKRVPRSVPDDEFNQIFARLPSHRDRALVAFYVSTGARASEGCCRPPRAAPTQVVSRSRWSARALGRCRSFRPRRTRSSGCGSISWRWRMRSPTGDGCLCGGRFAPRPAR